jgi:hypothetical protein
MPQVTKGALSMDALRRKAANYIGFLLRREPWKQMSAVAQLVRISIL